LFEAICDDIYGPGLRYLLLKTGAFSSDLVDPHLNWVLRILNNLIWLEIIIALLTDHLLYVRTSSASPIPHTTEGLYLFRARGCKEYSYQNFI
jgi:hypothetical protein